MITFLIAFLILLLGTFFYSKLIERFFKIDPDRKTPALLNPDGVDYIPMPAWKLFFIQLLNIAGLGPIFGALLGACWGPNVYFWIVLGTILGGGIHDYLSGMISLRHNGASFSELVGIYLGKFMLYFMRILTLGLLILVGANFAKNPAAIIDSFTNGFLGINTWIIIITIYYLIATFLPIDKIIGKVYPVLGASLLFMALGLFTVMLFNGEYRSQMPEMWEYFGKTDLHPNHFPLWVQMFVSVACGAVSGFHATQSPIVARCIKNERLGRRVFYGAMATEGFIALIWAAVGVTFYHSIGGLNSAIVAGGMGVVVKDICIGMLGTFGGALAILGVIACPISTGDTAYRSMRLIIADWLKLNQSSYKNRLVITIPILSLGLLLTYWGDMILIWKYFSWINQTMAMVMLWLGASYLMKNGVPPRSCLIAAIPATFMTAVVTTYFFQAKECMNMPNVAVPIGISFAVILLAFFIYKANRVKAIF